MTRFVLSLALACSLGALPAAAQDATFLEVREAVDKTIAPKLKEKGLTKVSFDWITTSTKVKLPGACGIANAFEVCLVHHGIIMVTGEKAVIHVKVTPVECDPESKLPATRLTIVLAIDGKQAIETVRNVFGAGDIAVMESLQISVPPGATSQDVAEAVNKARKAATEIAPAKPAAGQTKKFSDDKAKAVSLELLVGKTPAKESDFKEADFVARPLDSKCRIGVKDGESYILRVTSQLAYPIAISTTVDGLDWSALYGAVAKPEAKDAQPNTRYFVLVPAKGTVLIKGFMKDLKRTQLFNVARMPTEAAGRQADTGVVVVRFAACCALDGEFPEDEPKDAPDLSGVKTEPGVEIDVALKPVQQKIGKLRGTVVLTYGDFKD